MSLLRPGVFKQHKLTQTLCSFLYLHIPMRNISSSSLLPLFFLSFLVPLFQFFPPSPVHLSVSQSRDFHPAVLYSWLALIIQYYYEIVVNVSNICSKTIILYEPSTREYVLRWLSALWLNSLHKLSVTVDCIMEWVRVFSAGAVYTVVFGRFKLSCPKQVSVSILPHIVPNLFQVQKAIIKQAVSLCNVSQYAL